jgi:hypothetical protein
MPFHPWTHCTLIKLILTIIPLLFPHLLLFISFHCVVMPSSYPDEMCFNIIHYHSLFLSLLSPQKAPLFVNMFIFWIYFPHKRENMWSLSFWTWLRLTSWSPVTSICQQMTCLYSSPNLRFLSAVFLLCLLMCLLRALDCLRITWDGVGGCPELGKLPEWGGQFQACDAAVGGQWWGLWAQLVG